MDARYTDDSKYRDVGVHGNSYKARSDDDANHFRKDYFGKDIMFGASNQEVIIQIWKSFMELVKPVLYPDLEIISCSENSNLNAFIPYLPFEQYMENLNQKNK